MDENNKSFYPLDMFEFIHHPWLTPKHLGVFFCENSLKSAPIEKKKKCPKLDYLLVFLTVRSCS
jgi:hypothetical protein